MKFRFDDAFQKVYQLDGQLFIFCGTYYTFGINSKMSESDKLEIVMVQMENE